MENYQLLVNKENLHNYGELQDEKKELISKLKNGKNEGIQQKLAYISTYENHLVEKCEQGNRLEVANEINSFTKTLNLYDALVEISSDNKKLIIQLNEDIVKLKNPSEKNRDRLDLKQRQLAMAVDMENIIGHKEMPIQQKMKVLKQYILNSSEDNKEVYTGSFGKKISEYLPTVNKFSETEQRKFTFFSGHSPGRYVRNITPDILLPKIERKLAELDGKKDKTSFHKREVLKAAHRMLNDESATKEDLKEVIRKYPDYDSSFGPSEVKKLINQTLDCLETQTKRAELR